jgi:hypothetical protein
VIALLDDQAPMRDEVGQLARLAVTFQILRRRAQHPMIRRQLARNQMRCDLVADAHVQIETLRGDIDDPVEQVKSRTFSCGYAADKRATAGATTCRPKPKLLEMRSVPLGDALRRGHIFDQVLDVIENLLGPREHLRARLGDRHAPRGAVQQARAEIGFEHGDTLADERGRHAQQLRGIAVIPGDGIGKEVVPEGLRVLEAAAKKHGVAVHFDHFDFASYDYYAKHGEMMPEDWKEKIGKHDAIYFGAVGWPAKIPDHISLWGSLIKFRREFDQYVNLRPVRLMPGVPSPLANRKPGDIDFWVVRENTEGEYSSVGGRMFPAPSANSWCSRP